MNSTLSDILETGVTKTPSGNSTVNLHSSISASEGQYLQKLVRELDPTVSLEVGLAYGISALFICDALNVRPGTQHIAIDPNQTGAIDSPQDSAKGHSWGGIGIANLRRAGYGDVVRLIELPSYRALAELERAGQRIDFAFIDGWHTFDFALVDFFFIDRMLNVGGIVAFDDSDWLSIRKICRFVNNNLSYSVVPDHLPTSQPGPQPNIPFRRRLRPVVESILRPSPLRPILRPEVATPDKKVGLIGSCIAFRKEADDRRSFDHFVDF